MSSSANSDGEQALMPAISPRAPAYTSLAEVYSRARPFASPYSYYASSYFQAGNPSGQASSAPMDPYMQFAANTMMPMMHPQMVSPMMFMPPHQLAYNQFNPWYGYTSNPYAHVAQVPLQWPPQILGLAPQNLTSYQPFRAPTPTEPRPEAHNEAAVSSSTFNSAQTQSSMSTNSIDAEMPLNLGSRGRYEAQNASAASESIAESNGNVDITTVDDDGEPLNVQLRRSEQMDLPVPRVRAARVAKNRKPEAPKANEVARPKPRKRLASRRNRNKSSKKGNPTKVVQQARAPASVASTSSSIMNIPTTIRLEDEVVRIKPWTSNSNLQGQQERTSPSPVSIFVQGDTSSVSERTSQLWNKNAPSASTASTMLVKPSYVSLANLKRHFNFPLNPEGGSPTRQGGEDTKQQAPMSPRATFLKSLGIVPKELNASAAASPEDSRTVFWAAEEAGERTVPILGTTSNGKKRPKGRPRKIVAEQPSRI